MNTPTSHSHSEKNLTGQVYTQLKEGIFRLRYLPGEALTEARVAEEYHVSKTTAKLALRQLAQEGWVTSDFRRKIRVREIQPQTVQELYQFRELLEREALSRIFNQGLCWTYSFRLEEKLLCIQAVQNDLFAREQAEADWHAELISVYHSSLIDRVYGNLRDEAVRIAYFYMQRMDTPDHDYVQHILKGLHQIVQAIREQDQPTALAILEQDHWQGALDLALAAIADEKGGKASPHRKSLPPQKIYSP